MITVMRRLTVITVFVMLVAGCTTDSGGAGKPQVASAKPQATTTAESAPPPLETTAEQFVNDSNTTIGHDYTAHLQKYATPDCATEMLKLGATNTASPTRLVSATQDGTTGTTVTALRDDPTDTGSTLHWIYTDRWRFTCEGIFEVSVN